MSHSGHVLSVFHQAIYPLISGKNFSYIRPRIPIFMSSSTVSIIYIMSVSIFSLAVCMYRVLAIDPEVKDAATAASQRYQTPLVMWLRMKRCVCAFWKAISIIFMNSGALIHVR